MLISTREGGGPVTEFELKRSSVNFEFGCPQTIGDFFCDSMVAGPNLRSSNWKVTVRPFRGACISSFRSTMQSSRVESVGTIE